MGNSSSGYSNALMQQETPESLSSSSSGSSLGPSPLHDEETGLGGEGGGGRGGGGGGGGGEGGVPSPPWTLPQRSRVATGSGLYFGAHYVDTNDLAYSSVRGDVCG